MRNLIIAVLFGLFLIPPTAFATCSVTVNKNGNPVLKGCSAKQRKQFLKAFDNASSKPTAKAVDKVLRKRMGKFYLTIRSVCYGYGFATRKPLSDDTVDACVAKLGYSPKLVALRARNNIKAIKKCIGVKHFSKQLMCMINSPNSKELEDIILAALDLRDAHWKGLRDLNKFGCKLKRGKLQCASSIGLVLAALLMFLLGRLRPQLRVAIGIIAMVIGVVCASTADAACTDAEVAGNEVAAQYGLKLYDCDDKDDKNEVPQASKDAVFQVIWRGYLAKGGLKLGMSKSYIRSRWERAEGAFWAVWGDAPLWQAQVAAAICAKETLCGVVVKFSEWETHRFQSPKNNNGTIDCGVTQINSNSTSYSCDELQDLQTAFREQRRIIMLKVGGSNRKSVWKARIHRYNGSGMKARQYGQLIMSWAK